MKQHETADNSQGQLYIVPTPIGNLSDITQRALTVLQAVDLIAAEDTRHTGLLLQHFAINARLFALHDHNEQQKAETLVAKLKEGQNIALVSDAGTPLINDPGYHLVRTCREAGIRVVPLPGPCAAIAALSAAGLPSDRFCYEGFLPAKSKGRRDVLKELEAEPRTLIFYESTHRLLESLEDMVTVWGEGRYVVLARELTLTDIAQIRDNTPPELELEAFVHGAMCMSVSGRCLLSSYMTGRSGNRGECAQPCRWKYYLVEENRPGQYMPIGENEEGSYILNANDLCTAPFLDLICKAGVDSLKIEGRAKTFYYVASVTAAYRKALDQYLANPASDTFDLPDSVLDELNRTSHRHYSPGFYFGKEKALQTPSHTYVRDWDFIGTVDSWEDGVAHCTQRSKFCLGDSLEILQPDGSVVPVAPEWIKNAEGEAVDATPHPMMQYTIPCATPLMPYSLLRMQKRQ